MPSDGSLKEACLPRGDAVTDCTEGMSNGDCTLRGGKMLGGRGTLGGNASPA